MNFSPTFKEKVWHEAKSFAFIFLYVWAILGLFALHRNFLLGLDPLDGQLLAVINALILGKVIVVLEFFRAGRKLEHSQAILRIIGKSILFGLLLLAFHILEEGIRGWFHHKSFAESLAEISGGRLMEIGTLSLLFIISLLPYFFLREVVAAIGVPRLRKILFDSSAPE
jgi:hypothetical protein